MQQVNGGPGATRLTYFGASRRAVAVVVAAVVALLAGVTPMLVGHASNADAAIPGNILKRWVATMSGSQTITQAQAVADAQNYDVIVAKQNTFTPYLAAMRAANPAVKVIEYLNGAYAQQPQSPGSSSGYPTTEYAKDVNGNYITSQSAGNWLMDVTNSAWIQDRVTTCSGFISAGYDGCYLDVLGNVSVSPNYVSSVPFNPSTGQNWTASDWMTATANLGAAVKNANSTGFIVANGLENGKQYFTASQGPTSKLLTTLDGGNAQGWLRGASDPIDQFENQASWLNDVNLVVDAGTRNRSAMTMTKVWNVTPAPTQQQIDAVHRYALASFLMGTNGSQYFLFDSDPNDGAVAADHPYDHVNVGAATDTYSQDVSGAYVRHFTQGLAVVNPTTATVTMSLGATMTDLDGNSMSQVTLPPNTGNVFTGAPGPTTTSTTTIPTTTTTIKADPPSAPQNFAATGGCSGVLLNWSPPANNGGAPITRYNIYRGGWDSETFFASTTATSYNDNSGPQWAFNYYKVTAVNAGNKEGPPTQNSGGSMSCPPPPSTTTTTTRPPPTTTTTTRPTTTTSTSTTTTTRPTTTTSTSTTTTTRPTTTTSTSTTTTTIKPTTTTSTSTTTTTRPTTTTSTSTTTTTRPPPTTTTTTIKANPPSAPTNPALTSQCTGALLTWGPPASNGGAPIVSYKIYRGSWGAETFLTTVPATSTSFNDTTGGTWTWNYYRVTAVNSAGLEGPASADVGGYKTC